MLDFTDVSRAYFHADAVRDVYVKLPEEDSEPGMCGNLVKTMYGTRDAAQNWESAIGSSCATQVLRLASQCLFVHT